MFKYTLRDFPHHSHRAVLRRLRTEQAHKTHTSGRSSANATKRARSACGVLPRFTLGKRARGGAMGRKPEGVAGGVTERAEEEARRREAMDSAGERGRKRDYMRQWRADPQHRQHESLRRQHFYFRRKLRLANRPPFVGIRGQQLCGICGLRRPVEIIERLRVCETARSGFVRVLMPYCGHC